MTIKTWVLGLTVSIVFLSAVALVYGWVTEREARIRAESQAQAQDQARASIDAQLKALGQRQEAFQRQQDAKLDALQARFQQAQSPAQVATLVAQLMNLQKPIEFKMPPATPENPHPTPVAQVPAEDAPQIKNYVQACEECKLNLQTAKQDLTYSQQQRDFNAEKLKSMTEERDTWKETAQGGSKFERALGVVKWLVVGAAAGYLAHR